MSDYIPGTVIEMRHLETCRAPFGQYRVVVMDTITGEIQITIHDFVSLTKAQNLASDQTGGQLSEFSGQTQNKVYIFDDQGKPIDEYGCL